MGVVKVTSAYKKYSSKSEVKVVLDNFHMNVKTGSIYALMGASGCGKTTLISCIVGTNSLDSGKVEVFYNKVGTNNTKIGYMPQEMALIPEFTIRESIHFYGIIYGMDNNKIDERIQFLCQLLDLQDSDKLVKNCSGGQQRRVSFAVALVHEPEILILDEPTVGVDPLLRFRIWNYLVDLTRTKNVTVLMSTHYIEEARKSTHVGLMRKGILLIEDTPQNLLELCDTQSLETAFLHLSEQQENGLQPLRAIATSEMTEAQAKRLSKSKVEYFPPSFGTKIRALIMKSFIQTIRDRGSLFVAIVMPLCFMICFHYGIGANPKGISFGIVSDEIESYDICSNRSLVTFKVDGYECQLNKVSCRFINEINENFAIKKFYNSQEDAANDVRHGNLVGFVYFSQNFSDSFTVLQEWINLTYAEQGHIQVFMDNSDLQIVTFLQRNLYDAYHRFVESLMNDCEKSTKAGSIPMVFETYHGSLKDEMKNAMIPGFIVASLFAMASYITSLTLIEDRRSGIWNRTLTAGATPLEFLISHMILGSSIMMVQAVEFIVYTTFIGNDGHTMNFVVSVSTFIILLGFSGTLFGLCISVITDSVLVATYISLVLTLPLLFLSGIMWPLQAIPLFLRYIGYLLPFTLPSRTFLSLMFHELKFTDSTIYLGFMVVLSWIIIELIFCICFSWPNSEKTKTK